MVLGSGMLCTLSQCSVRNGDHSRDDAPHSFFSSYYFIIAPRTSAGSAGAIPFAVFSEK